MAMGDMLPRGVDRDTPSHCAFCRDWNKRDRDRESMGVPIYPGARSQNG